MVCCCVVNCHNRQGRDPVRFFRIPKVLQGCPLTVKNSQNQQNLWITRINRKNIDRSNCCSKSKVICSVHFVNGFPANHMDVTNPDWAPSLNLGYELKPPCQERYRRCQERRRILGPHNRLPNAENLNAAINPPGVHFDQVQHDNVNEEVNVALGPDNADAEADHHDQGNNEVVNHADLPKTQLDAECQTVFKMDGIFALESKLRYPPFSEEHLSEGSKCSFFTGVEDIIVLKMLFDLVSPYVSKCYEWSHITKFQEFAAVLARLRLGLLEEDLADRLGVSQSCVSKFFNLWIPVMADCFKHFIVWPDRETLRKTMPECFLDSFGRSVAVIIDCFEVHVQSPSGLLAKAQTYSHYKSVTTVKFLIGITPQGTVSYISCGWGGRTSDKWITEHCNDFLNNLLPGDIVLADRGFDIGETTGQIQARLITPAFMNKRLQLSSNDVEMSRRVASVRIHVERLIGLVRRKFKILHEKLNFSFLQHASGRNSARIDDVIVISCALCNICQPIVPMCNTPVSSMDRNL